MPNVNNMLIVRPRDCRYCGNGYHALGHVVNYARSKGFNVSDMADDLAEKNPIYNEIDAKDPLSIYEFGHGSADRITGNSETNIFTTTTGLEKLSGRLIYFLSCITAQQLGPAIIQNGGISYAGFTDEWSWAMEGSTDIDPYTDRIGKGFYESANQLWISLIDGSNFEDAVQASVMKYNQWIDYWMNSGDLQAGQIIGMLAIDRDLLTLLGSHTARIDEDLCEQYVDETGCITNSCNWWPDQTCHTSSYSGVEIPSANLIIPVAIAGTVGIVLLFVVSKGVKKR